MEQTKVWDKDEIKSLLANNVNAVQRAIVSIWKFQTEDEKRIGDTRHHNGVGFNGADAGIMTSFAEQINRGKTLTPKQYTIAAKKIQKYAGQLCKIANGEITLPE
ncbi:MAG: hypothetical protein K0R18_373 [Bacillales bacterium]|jgi:hypothetical protein|nr:hypothetical protein [Bacillales bacterium]